MLTNLKIGTRLAAGFALILALLLVITGTGLNRMGAMSADTDKIVSHYYAQDRMARDLAEQVFLVSRLIRTVLLMDNQADKQVNAQKVGKAVETFDELARALEASTRSVESRAILAEILKLHTKAREGNGKVLALAMAGKDAEANRMLFGEARASTQALQDSLGRASKYFREQLEKAHIRAAAAHEEATLIMLTVMGLALALGAVLAFLITRSILQPLRTMGAVIETVAQGDLTQRVEIDSKDELGELGRTLNRTNEGLREMV
ncbi:MAG: MCP four helix bundle domain-containing protein, partial [Acidobacteria bacterium]|nr:MCP four helix bundle domain-containing protein [Acidobacteriota bacterium]